MCVGKILREGMALVAVAEAAIDAQPDIQPVHLITQREQDIPQREAVFATADRHQNAFVAREHVIFLDDAVGLLVDPLDEVRAA